MGVFMINRIISVFFLGYICITCLLMFVGALIIWLLTVGFDKQLKILHLYTSFWASIYIWTMPAWSLTIKGKSYIDNKKTYIVTSNHQSLLDILVAFRLFFHFKWVSKVEIFKIPLVGWNMYLNQYIPLVRGDKNSVQKMFDDCNKSILQGNSIYMFPEGTRSKTRELKAFKSGAFVIAKKNNIPILPIAISGTREALPRNSLNFHGKKTIIVTVLPEIPVEIVENLSVDELSHLVRCRISEQVIQNYAIIDGNKESKSQ